MPSISRVVAQQKPLWPATASSWARAVDLNALTCGRSRLPGRAAAMVATLWSNASMSTISAGVGSSLTSTSARLADGAPPDPPSAHLLDVHHRAAPHAVLLVV